jgi:hypothetical protein
LANTHFRLSQEDIDAFDSGDHAVVPRLLARAHVESMRSMAEMFDRVVPVMVVQGIQAATANAAADAEFYGPNKDLEPHRAQVMELAKTLRQMNPKMPKEQFIPLLATSARAMLGMQPQAAPAQVAPASAPVAQPAPARQAPPQPITSSVPAAFAAPPVVDPNDWGATDALFDRDDF